MRQPFGQGGSPYRGFLKGYRGGLPKGLGSGLESRLWPVHHHGIGGTGLRSGWTGRTCICAFTVLRFSFAIRIEACNSIGISLDSM